MAKRRYEAEYVVNLNKTLTALQKAKEQAAEFDDLMSKIGDRGNLNSLIDYFLKLDTVVDELRTSTDSLMAELGDSLKGGYISSLDGVFGKLADISNKTQAMLSNIGTLNLADPNAPEQLEQMARQVNDIFKAFNLNKKIDIKTFLSKPLEEQRTRIAQQLKLLNKDINTTLGNINVGNIQGEFKAAFDGVSNGAEKATVDLTKMAKMLGKLDEAMAERNSWAMGGSILDEKEYQKADARVQKLKQEFIELYNITDQDLIQDLDALGDDEDEENLKNITKRFKEFLSVNTDVSSTSQKVGQSIDTVGKHVVDTTEYINGMRLSLEQLFAVMSKPMETEYKILMNGQDMNIHKGQNQETSMKTMAESYLSNLVTGTVLDAHSHQGKTLHTNASDFRVMMNDYYSGTSQIGAVIGGQGITTVNLDGVAKEDAEKALAAMKKRSTPELSAKDINKIFKEINPQYSNVSQEWKPEQFGDLAKYIYDVGAASENALTPVERFQNIIKRFGPNIDLSKYSNLMQDFSPDNAKQIFNKIMLSEKITDGEGKLLQVQNVSKGTLSDVTNEIEQQKQKFQEARDTAEVTYQEIAQAAEKYLNTRHKKDKDVGWFNQYFHPEEFDQLDKRFEAIGFNEDTLDAVVNQIAGQFAAIDIDNLPDLQSQKDIDSEIEDTNKLVGVQNELADAFKRLDELSDDPYSSEDEERLNAIYQERLAIIKQFGDWALRGYDETKYNDALSLNKEYEGRLDTLKESKDDEIYSQLDEYGYDNQIISSAADLEALLENRKRLMQDINFKETEYYETEQQCNAEIEERISLMKTLEGLKNSGVISQDDLEDRVFEQGTLDERRERLGGIQQDLFNLDDADLDEAQLFLDQYEKILVKTAGGKKLELGPEMSEADYEAFMRADTDKVKSIEFVRKALEAQTNAYKDNTQAAKRAQDAQDSSESDTNANANAMERYGDALEETGNDAKEALSKLEQFKELTAEIVRQGAFGQLGDDVNVGKLTAQLEAAKAELDALAEKGKFAQSVINDISNQFRSAQVALEHQVTHNRSRALAGYVPDTDLQAYQQAYDELSAEKSELEGTLRLRERENEEAQQLLTTEKAARSEAESARAEAEAQLAVEREVGASYAERIFQTEILLDKEKEKTTELERQNELLKEPAALSNSMEPGEQYFAYQNRLDTAINEFESLAKDIITGGIKEIERDGMSALMSDFNAKHSYAKQILEEDENPDELYDGLERQYNDAYKVFAAARKKFEIEDELKTLHEEGTLVSEKEELDSILNRRKELLQIAEQEGLFDKVALITQQSISAELSRQFGLKNQNQALEDELSTARSVSQELADRAINAELQQELDLQKKINAERQETQQIGMFEGQSGQFSMLEDMAGDMQKAEANAEELQDTLKNISVLDGQISFDDIELERLKAANEELREQKVLKQGMVAVPENTAGINAAIAAMQKQEAAIEGAVVAQKTLNAQQNIDNSTASTDEVAQYNRLLEILKQVKAAADLKTDAFREEGAVVEGVVRKEIAALAELLKALGYIKLAVDSIKGEAAGGVGAQKLLGDGSGTNSSFAIKDGGYALEGTLQKSNSILGNILAAVKSDNDGANKQGFNEKFDFGVASSAVLNQVQNLGSEAQLKGYKQLANGLVQFEGVVKNSEGVWKGFVANVNKSNQAVHIAEKAQSAYANALNKATGETQEAAAATAAAAGTSDKLALDLARDYYKSDSRYSAQQVEGYANNTINKLLSSVYGTTVGGINGTAGAVDFAPMFGGTNTPEKVAQMRQQYELYDQILQRIGYHLVEWKENENHIGFSAEIVRNSEHYVENLEEARKVLLGIGEQIAKNSVKEQAANVKQEQQTAKRKKAVYGSKTVIDAKAKYNGLINVAREYEKAGSIPVGNAIAKYGVALEALIDKQKTFNDMDVVSEDDKVKFKELQNECNKYAQALTKLINESQKLHHKGKNPASVDTTMYDLETTVGRESALKDYVDNLGDAVVGVGSFNDASTELTYTIKNEDGSLSEMTASLDATRTSIVSTTNSTKQAGSIFKTFFNELKGKSKQILTYMSARMGFDELIQQVRKGIQYIRDIDKALTELKKVTDETDASYDAFLDTMSKTAEKVGSTVANLTTMAAEWARLGYSMEDSAKLAESTAVLLNVSEFSDATAASEALISTMQAFQYTADESQHVVDILNEVGKTLIAPR